MRKTLSLMCLLVLTGVRPSLYAQELQTSISGFGAITTSSKLFYHPHDTNELTRGQYLGLDNVFSGGIDVRKEILQYRLQLGLSIEYISSTNEYSIPVSTFLVPVRDGYTAVPVELTAYFIIPFSGDQIKISMGGGAGVYFGNRTYDEAGEQAYVTDRTMGYGIHIVSGLEYYLAPSFSLRSNVKFRDVQFETINQFITSTVRFANANIPLPPDPLESRIAVDGMNITLGIVVHF